jgi:5-methylcytosine-specific restriction endonuclease McrA
MKLALSPVPSAAAHSFEVRLRNRRPSNEELIEDLQRVSRERNGCPVTHAAYTDRGRFGINTIVHRFGSWNAALRAAGLPINIDRDMSDGELLQNLADLWRKLGRQPIGRDLVKRDGLSRFSSAAYEARFGSWNKALMAFADFINDRRVVEDTNRQKANPTTINDRDRSPRKINWRLRAVVLIRDNCICRMCGASPAKDPAVTLHVDHIEPWSKGGATTLDNLQTLCSACNIGKGDRVRP